MNLKPVSTLLLSHLNPSARVRLFCFPNAGGGAALLHSWLNGLPPDIDLCPIHLPGREKRRLEPPFRRMGSLIQAVCRELEPFLDIPFALFGHSLGALMAFEMAHELRRRGLGTPMQLFVSAHAAPQNRRTLEPIHQLPDREFVTALVQRYDAIPAPVLADKDLMAIFIPAIRADLEILETYTYQPAPPLHCPITVLSGIQDPTVTAGELDGWQQHTLNSFGIHRFPGKHSFLKEARPQVLPIISRGLSSSLDGNNAG